MPQVYEIIADEHRTMERMLDEVVTGQPEQPQIERLYRLVDAHARAEEQTLYQDLTKDEQTHELILEAVEEHHVADVLLDEIRKLNPTDERVHAKLVVLKDDLRHHFIEEERVLFRHARQIMDDEWAERMGARFDERERQIDSTRV
jgi:hemerythrin superfamily protein